MSTTEQTGRIEAVRRFNRFYTRQVGALNEGLLKSPFSLPEARVIWELAHRERATATDLGEWLELDAGYLSRLLRGLHKRGVIDRTQSEEDGRRKLLTLTSEGAEAFAKLNAASRAEIGELLDGLAEEDRRRLVGSMGVIEEVLGARPEPQVPYLLRPPGPGDMGWVVQRHGAVYAREYAWDERFEALVAEIVAGFIRNFDRRRERCWIAEKDGENVGSIFCVRQSDTVAKLRLLLVEPQARGLGIGRRLVRECIRFARDTGYGTLTLWTNDVLTAARRIYETEGFRIVATEPYEGFGQRTISETWELEL